MSLNFWLMPRIKQVALQRIANVKAIPTVGTLSKLNIYTTKPYPSTYAAFAVEVHHFQILILEYLLDHLIRCLPLQAFSWGIIHSLHDEL